MSSWKTYRLGFDFLRSNTKLLFMLLLINLFAAIFIAMPINNYIDLSIGDSLSMKVFNNGFDYMLISDFLDNYGMGIDAIMHQSTYSLLLLFLMSIFISGSILWSIRNNRFSKNDFFVGGAHYFWKLLRLSAVFIILYILVLVIVFNIFSMVNNGLSPFAIESDATLISSFWMCSFGFAILVALVSTIHNIAKIDIMYSNNKWVFKSFAKACSILRKHFLSFIGIFFINLGLLLLIGFIYFILRKIIPCEGGLGLVALMLVAQLFMLSKIALNIVNTSSFYFMYKNKLNVVDTQL